MTLLRPRGTEAWPLPLKPQATTVPSSFTARLCDPPPAIPKALVMTGASDRPKISDPQHTTLPGYSAFTCQDRFVLPAAFATVTEYVPEVAALAVNV